MAAEQLAFGSYAYPGVAPDMSVQTSPGGVWSVVYGADGTDWHVGGLGPGSSLQNRRFKANGGQQLLPVPYFTTGSALTVNTILLPLSPTWTIADEWAKQTVMGPGCGAMTTPTAAQVDCGVIWNNTILAPNGKIKTLTWAGQVAEGTWVAEATLSDGALGTKTLTVGTGAGPTNTGFTLTFMGSSVATKLLLKIRRTVATANPGSVTTQYMFIAPAVDAPTSIVPIRRQLLMHGIAGGPLA